MNTRLWTSLREEESGLTLVELLVAAVILLIAATGALQLFISAGSANLRAEQRQVAIERVQAELEQIRTLSYEELALDTTPASSADQTKPGWRVTGGCASQGPASTCFALNRNGSNRQPLVVNGEAFEEGGEVVGAGVSAAPEAFTTGDVSGTIHRYVVWQNDPGCGDIGECQGTQDFKRVVVAVEIGDSVAGDRTYQEIQSEFIDPEAGKDSEPLPSEVQQELAQPLWLSDTSCDETTNRTSPTGNHNAHNTLGACSDPKSDTGIPGPPDLLLDSQPDQTPQEFDLAADIEPLIDENQDAGRQIEAVEDLLTCNINSLNRRQRHTWVTEPIPAGTGNGSGYVIDGDPTLELFTRTTNVAAGLSGALCVKLFIRDDGIGGAFVDTPLRNGFDGTDFFRFDQSPWPSAGWTRLTYELDVQSPGGSETVIVQPGQRLGMSIAVDLDGSVESPSLSLFSFMYEHPDFDSRLEVVTSTPYDGTVF